MLAKVLVYYEHVSHSQCVYKFENCDLGHQIRTSHRWDDGHERVGVLRLWNSAKESENEECSELLLKQNTLL